MNMQKDRDIHKVKEEIDHLDRNFTKLQSCTGRASVPDAEIQVLLTKLEEANDVLTEILEPAARKPKDYITICYKKFDEERQKCLQRKTVCDEIFREEYKSLIAEIGTLLTEVTALLKEANSLSDEDTTTPTSHHAPSFRESPHLGNVRKLTPKMKTRIAERKERTTYLVIYTTPIASGSDEEVSAIYRSQDGEHAEKLMLTELPKKYYQLPEDIFLSRSPCESCAVKLLKAYRFSKTKPTIYVADIYKGKWKKDFSITNHHIQGLVELMRNSFQLEVWDWYFDLHLPKGRKDYITRELSICSRESFPQAPLDSTPVAVVCQLPLKYAERMPPITKLQDCRVLLTFVYNDFSGEYHYVRPMVIIKHEEETYQPETRDLKLVVLKQATTYCDTKEVMMNCWAQHCWGRDHRMQKRKCIFFIDHGREFKMDMKNTYNTDVEYVGRHSPYTALYFACIEKFKDKLAEKWRKQPLEHTEDRLLKIIHEACTELHADRQLHLKEPVINLC